jgi:hypothetical protein
VPTVLQELHGGAIGGHFFSNIIMRKIIDVGYWWSMMNWNVHEYCWTCDQCQKNCNLLTQNLAKLIIALHEEPFIKWRLDFIGPIKPTSKMSGNQYIMGRRMSILHQHYCNNCEAFVWVYFYEIWMSINNCDWLRYPFYQWCDQIPYWPFYL